MKFLLIIIVEISLLNVGYSQRCSSEAYAFRNSPPSCVFTYCSNNFTTPSCTVKRGYYDGSYRLPSWQAVWELCTMICCDSTVTYPMAYQSIAKCQQYLDSLVVPTDNTNKIIIGVSISFGALFIIIVIICIYRRYVRSRNRQSSLVFHQNIMRQDNYFNNSSYILPQMPLSQMNFHKPPQKNWTLNRQRQQNNEQVCAICLENQPSVETSCHHFFHGQCIIAYFKRKRQCPICRNMQLNEVEVHCIGCWNYSYKSEYRLFQRFCKSQKQRCSRCIEKVNYQLQIKQM